MYLFAHIVRTQSQLLGVAITMFIIMDIFWLIIPAAILGGLGVSKASTTYILGNVAFGYASPAGWNVWKDACYSETIQCFVVGRIGHNITACFSG